MLSQKYRIIEPLHENETTVVYRANRISDHSNVIIKMLKVSEMRHYRMIQMMNEQKLLHQLTFPTISHLIEVIATPTEYAHVFEDIGGSSLYDLLFSRTFTIEETLFIALGIAEAMDYLHTKRIVHADINPKNIIYNPVSKAVNLIDFGYSFVIQRHQNYNDMNAGTSGNVMYMSPEQTGRTRQKIDARSDFYSFGMTLYHLFSGESPYTAADRYEMVHKQIALTPEALSEKIEGFPPTISALVKKLIEKSPNHRYQSDYALIYDLKNILQSLGSEGAIEAFEIGSMDRPSFLHVEGLYGREPLLERLYAIETKLMEAKPFIITLSGSGGIGKTRLVDAFLQMLQNRSLQILRSKFEQNRSIHPYHALHVVFKQIVEQLCDENAPVEKPRISDQTREVLATFFPMFEGKKIQRKSDVQEHLKQLPYAISELFRAVASERCPIVIVLDDIHWIDRGSAELISKSIIESGIRYVHLIMTYRDREFERNPFALRFREQLNESIGNRSLSLTVGPLALDDYVQMMYEWFDDRTMIDHEILKLLYKKTAGNPFYFILMLENLFESGLIRYDRGQWKAQNEMIRHASISEDRDDWIRERLERLNEQGRDILSVLSMVGNGMYRKFIESIIHSIGYASKVLTQLDLSGYIDISEDRCYFVHDLLYEYTNRSISVEKKKEFLRAIATELYRFYRLGEYHDIVQLTHFLNETYPGTLSKKVVRGLNVEALGMMMNTHEYSRALKRLEWMDEMGMDDELQTHRERFENETLRFKVFYLGGMHEQAAYEIERLRHESKSLEERIECFRYFKDLCVTRGEGFEMLCRYGETIFDELRFELPRGGMDEAIHRLRHRIDHHSKGRTLKEILTLSPMQNRQKRRIIAMLVEYWESVYYLSDLARMQWAYLSIVDLSFRYGNTSGSAFGYVLYGGSLVGSNRYKDAYRFGEAALKLTHTFGDTVMLPKIYNFVANFISPYTHGVEANIPLYRKSLEQSKINGDIVFGTWANFLIHFSRFFSGTSLEALRTSMEEESGWLLYSNDQKMIAMFRTLRQLVASYQQNQPSSGYRSDEAVALWESENFLPGLAWYGILRAQECWFRGEIEEGLESLERYVQIDSNEVIMFPKQYVHLYRALMTLGKRTPLSSTESTRLSEDLALCDAYAKASPKTFRFWKILLKAKSARGSKNLWDIAKDYDRALAYAKEVNHPMYIAIGAMCSGRFWESHGYTDMSRFYFSEASIGFNQWGAFGLSVLFRPSTMSVHEKEGIEAYSDHSSSSSLLRTEPANFRTLIKSINTLSQSIGKDELLTRLMQMILQSATASKAVVILKEEDEYFVKAYMTYGEEAVQLKHQRLEQCTHVPYHVIRHALKYETKVMQYAPAENGRFQFDEYFHTHRPASCSAMSALIEGEIRAVLYLENEKISTPLDEGTVQTLRLLLTQAGIIYKNVRLYELLQNNEEHLNKAQEIARLGSYRYNMTTDELVWSTETYRIYGLEPFSVPITQSWVMGHFHPDDLPKVLDEFEKVMGGQPYCNLVSRIITANGDVRTVHQRAEIYWDEHQLKVSGTIQDITELRRAEEKIETLSQVVYQTPFSVIITDERGVIEYANTQALAMTGYFAHELMGQKMSMFSSGVHNEAFYTSMWESISVRRESWRGVIVNRMKNGHLRDCDSTIYPIIGTHGSIVNFVTIQDDVTERNLKDRLFLMQTRQAQMGEMLSIIAHQWRQPLAIMNALIARQKLNILLEKTTFDEVGENLNEMETQIQHLSRTITEFKDFFKPDKQTALSSTTMIIEKALGLIEHACMTRGVIIEKNLNDTSEFQTYEGELIQVVLNLIKNALDAFDEQPVLVPQIKISTFEEGNDTTIIIEDNALGISETVMENLFSPYVSTKSENGTGLGLYMSKIIMEEHCHGTIEAQNSDAGARFTLTIPKDHIR